MDQSLRRSNVASSEHHPVFYDGDRYESANSLAGLGGGVDDSDRQRGSSMHHSSSNGSLGDAGDRSRHTGTSGFAGFDDVAGADGGALPLCPHDGGKAFLSMPIGMSVPPAKVPP